MIFDTPCRRYLLYLLLRGDSVQKVEDHALELALDYGSIQLLVYLKETNMPPQIFRPQDPEHTPSQDFLQSVGLEGNFPKLSGDVKAAFRLHQNPRAREVLELGLLGGLPKAEILELLHAQRSKTKIEVVEAYAQFFWDVRGMDSTVLRALLNLRSPDTARLQKMAAFQDSRELESGDANPVADQVGSRGGVPQGNRGLPLPHQTQVPERPSASELNQARSWREGGRRGFMRQLARSMPVQEQARQAEAIKRANYSNPRLSLSSLPPSPLTLALTRSYLGMDLDRLDLQKAYEVLHHLLFHRTVEQAVTNHPEAAIRITSLLSASATLLRIQKELGSGSASLQNQIQVMALQNNVEGHYGDADEFTGGHHRLSPYSEADAATLAEITGKGTSRGGKQVTTIKEDEAEEEDEEAEVLPGVFRVGV